MLKRKPRSDDSQPPGDSAWGWLELADGIAAFEGSIGGFIGMLIVIALITIGVALLLPAVVLLVELILVVVLVGAGVLVRVLFRRPWLIDAEVQGPEGQDRLTWAVVGYRRSSEAVEEIADQLRRGVFTPVVRDSVVVSPNPH
jgi:hypothetical protein